MENYLLKEIKQMQGTLLGIGITSEKIKKAIENNKNITICNLLEKPEKQTNKKKLKIKNKTRTINIKKIKKTFRKKRIESIICNEEIITPFLKTFVRDSVYINKGKLYIYGKKQTLETIKEKYQRYTNDIQLIENKNSNILIINNKNTKNNKIKDIGYWWKDTATSFLDLLTLILTN